MPEGYEVVGVIPGKRDTYFIRMPSGMVRPACMRRRRKKALLVDAERGLPAHPFCMRHPMKVDGRHYACCQCHTAKGSANRIRLRNIMDPKFISLVHRAAESHPAIDQIQQRIDMIDHAWLLLIEAISARDKALSEREDLPRDIGVDQVIGAAANVRDATKVQSKPQADVFRATGRGWAQQAYSLRLAQALADAARPEGAAATQRVGRRMEAAMKRRGLIVDEKNLPGIAPPPEATSVDLQVEEVQKFTARNRREGELIAALAATGRAENYAFLVDSMQDKVLSLYPLIRVLDALIVQEEAAGAPITVKNKFVRARNKAADAQVSIEKSLDLRLTQKQAKEIGDRIVESVIEATEDERPDVQHKILTRFLELKKDVHMPTRADGAVGVVMDALKEADLGRR